MKTIALFAMPKKGPYDKFTRVDFFPAEAGLGPNGLESKVNG